jgi:hypothetical protein
LKLLLADAELLPLASIVIPLPDREAAVPEIERLALWKP